MNRKKVDSKITDDNNTHKVFIVPESGKFLNTYIIEEAIQLIEKGLVTINGDVCLTNIRMKKGDEISINLTPQNDSINDAEQRRNKIEQDSTQDKIQSDNVEKELQEVSTIKKEKEELEQELTSLQNEIQKLQSQKKEEEENLKVDINEVIGKLNIWSKSRFEELQINTQGYYNDFIYKLSELQEDLKIKMGKQPQKVNETDEKPDKYTVPQEEKVSTLDGYVDWFQQKIDNLTVKNESLFLECNSSLEYYKRRLEKYGEDEKQEQTEEKKDENNPAETKKGSSIIDDVKQAISDFWQDLKSKERRTEYVSKQKKQIEIAKKHPNKNEKKRVWLIRLWWILCISVSVFALLIFLKYLFPECFEEFENLIGKWKWK